MNELIETEYQLSETLKYKRVEFKDAMGNCRVEHFLYCTDEAVADYIKSIDGRKPITIYEMECKTVRYIY